MEALRALERQGAEVLLVDGGSQDGSATVEVRWATGVRHVLFVQGKPTAWDSAQDGAFTHAGDRTILRLGTSETFEIPDALIRGG